MSYVAALFVAVAIVMLRYSKPYDWVGYIALTLIVWGGVINASNLAQHIAHHNAACETTE